MKTHAKLFSAVIFTALFLLSGSALAQTGVDPIGKPAIFTCPNGAALHFDKIIFSIERPIFNAENNKPVPLAYPLKTELDIKVLDNPESVADLKGKVLSFLGALYVTNDPTGATDPTLIKIAQRNRASIKIINVDYAVICDSKPNG